MPHRSWRVPHKNRAVDKKGVAVALAFLVALGVLAGGRGEHRDRVEDLISRANAPARDSSLPSNPALTGERAMIDGPLAVPRRPLANAGPALMSVPWISMPYLSGSFKPGIVSMESPAVSQIECSTAGPSLRMPVTEAGERDSGQIFRSPMPHGSGPLYQSLTQEGGTPCQSHDHPSALLLMTDNRLTESVE